MSDEESDQDNRRNKVQAMPKYNMRFTDMPPNLVEKAIRCKLTLLFILIHYVVIGKCNEGHKFDKDVALAITKGMAADPELCDECAGWHVIVGKSFAGSIQYQTTWVLFFDLLGDVHKTFLIFKTQ